MIAVRDGLDIALSVRRLPGALLFRMLSQDGDEKPTLPV
jgi:hypothetical protein